MQKYIPLVYKYPADPAYYSFYMLGFRAGTTDVDTVIFPETPREIRSFLRGYLTGLDHYVKPPVNLNKIIARDIW